MELPVIERPDPVDLERDRVHWLERQKEADEQGDPVAARDYGARAERAKRWLGRLASFPDTENIHHVILHLPRGRRGVGHLRR